MDKRRFGRRLIASGTVATLLLGMLAVTAPVVAKQFGVWVAPSRVGLESVNTTALEGCSMQSPDGLSLYFASNRANGEGGLDIYVSNRADTGDAWGVPENLGDTINSTANEFCPTPVRGKGLYFVSTRTDGYGLNSSGAGDLYFTRLPAHDDWTTPVNLGSYVNSADTEAGPSYFEADGRGFLYFSSGGDPNTSEIYVSEQASDGSFGPRAAVVALNSAFDDFRPNVRKNGLEVVFDSNRDGYQGGTRNLDIWTATRPSVADPWSVLPSTNHLGTVVNTPAAEVRASFSWDGSTLYFGSTRPGGAGSSDLYFTTR